jgi:ubiquinone/menaquinone biosynthesis C-methylase UbiE
MENSSKNIKDLHKTVLDWETTEAKRLMESIGIKPGDKIVDFACGYGHYTFPCALALNKSGIIYAIDKDINPLKWIKTKMEMFDIQNIETIRTSGSWNIEFPVNSIDIVLLYDVIHAQDIHTKQTVRFQLYHEAQRILKQGGILSMLTFDSEKKKLSSQNKDRGKMTYQDIINEITEIGFTFSNKIDGAIHFDHYHSNYQRKKGITFSELEKGSIYNFIKNE